MKRDERDISWPYSFFMIHDRRAIALDVYEDGKAMSTTGYAYALWVVTKAYAVDRCLSLSEYYFS
ncbi:MAG: hypothetical protein KME52_18725 [Desmonostoc geniculatum HA4340-LM1]|jgi:hypothetical protein|nr:hypothetical protein [Desmonostoc geniculatum HA4340-LM1]